MDIDICICTHNPRISILACVMSSIRHQQMQEGDTFRVIVVDNASNPPLTETVFESLKGSDISFRLIQEPLPGIARARAAAAMASAAEWILFVDDDNELDSDYIISGLRVIRGYPKVGCFGGKLLLPDSIEPPLWTQSFFNFLGIRDYGDERIERMSDHWGPWEPPTAGAFVHRDVLQEYLRKASSSDSVFILGRTAERLLSCEDSLIMLGAANVGRSNAYEPSLILRHHLAQDRFRFSYLMRLMYGYGMSRVILDTLSERPLTIPDYYISNCKFFAVILYTLWAERKKPIQYVIGKIVYRLGIRHQLLLNPTNHRL